MNNSFLAATAVSSMKAWLAAFDTLEALKPQTIVPAHGEVGPGTIIATNRSIMQGVQARARALKAEASQRMKRRRRFRTNFRRNTQVGLARMGSPTLRGRHTQKRRDGAV